MRIIGAGGCMDNRVYEIAIEDAWKVMLECLHELGMEVDEKDDVHHVLKAHTKKKLIDATINSLDADTVEVIFDAHKQHIEVYSWKRDNTDVDDFFELYEKKLVELKAFILCPNCHTKVSSTVKYCPECGTKLQHRSFED